MDKSNTSKNNCKLQSSVLKARSLKICNLIKHLTEPHRFKLKVVLATIADLWLRKIFPSAGDHQLYRLNFVKLYFSRLVIFNMSFQSVRCCFTSLTQKTRSKVGISGHFGLMWCILVICSTSAHIHFK